MTVTSKSALFNQDLKQVLREHLKTQSNFEHMPRLPRKFQSAPQTLYHVTCRGNNQQKIFKFKRDRKKFLWILREVKKRLPFKLYAYSLMPNHYHLMIETIEASLSKIMHLINNTYVKYFNTKYKKRGHLFEDRFYSIVVDKESYFWELSRYIHLNAFRAGLAKRPEDYLWSSYIIYLAKNPKDDLVDREILLNWIEGKDLEEKQKAYQKFVEAGIEKKLDLPWVNKIGSHF